MAEAAAGGRKRKAMRIREGGTHFVEPQRGRSAERDGKEKAGPDQSEKTDAVESKEGAK